ncbi:MAG: hypothetical protein ACFB0D_22970 [Phormidesmis sp.]
MLKRGTLLLMLSAIALGGAVLLLENQAGPQSEESPNDATEAAASEKLFPFEEDEVEQFSVTRQQSDAAAEGEETLSFVKNDEGTWQMSVPQEAMAEGGAIAFLLFQVATPDALPVFVNANNLEEFGLAEPESTVAITANGNEYLLHVGGLDFLGDKRYVEAIEEPDDSATNQADADADEQTKIYAISGSIINAVNRPSADWLLVDDTSTAPEQESETSEGETSEGELSEGEASENEALPVQAPTATEADSTDAIAPNQASEGPSDETSADVPTEDTAE